MAEWSGSLNTVTRCTMSITKTHTKRRLQRDGSDAHSPKRRRTYIEDGDGNKDKKPLPAIEDGTDGGKAEEKKSKAAATAEQKKAGIKKVQLAE